jgi:hypothetical protein
MRNRFDQYRHPENRLTHAFLTSLDADRGLLKRFLQLLEFRPGRQRVQVFEQSLPGEVQDLLDEDEAERRGLPDGCITIGSDFTLLIESKLSSELRADQLMRHARTADRRGLIGIRLLALTIGPLKHRLPKTVLHLQWTDVYSWLQRETARSSWASCCCEYMEILEERESDSGYLTEGTLTVFSGIPFGKETPYSYSNAKRLLRLLREELCKDKGGALSRFGADVKSQGRSAITGRDHTSVWDYIPLNCAKHAEVFTQFPHLTIGLGATAITAQVTIPNGVKSRIRTRLLGQNPEGFENLAAEVLEGFLPIVKKSKGIPVASVVQRHYKSQRSAATVDSQLRFDLRTAVAIRVADRKQVRYQPEWLHAAREALASRRSNLQLQFGVEFPYDSCPVVKSPQIVSDIRDVFLACAPVVRTAEA